MHHIRLLREQEGPQALEHGRIPEIQQVPERLQDRGSPGGLSGPVDVRGSQPTYTDAVHDVPSGTRARRGGDDSHVLTGRLEPLGQARDDGLRPAQDVRRVQVRDVTDLHVTSSSARDISSAVRRHVNVAA